MLKRAFSGLVLCNTLIIKACEATITVLLAVMAGLLFCAVVWRYFLNDPISWSEDFTLVCLVWMTFLGAPVGMRGGHIATDFVLHKLPESWSKILSVLANVGVLFVAITVIIYGVPFVKQGMARIIPSMDWLSHGYSYLALPVGFALIVPLCIENIFSPFVQTRITE